VPDHIEVLKQIKGSSSHLINQNNLIDDKFAWQTGYAAYSVSESVVEKVYEYIKNQKSHHNKKTFQQEYEAFKKFYGFENK
jgi:REP element-mobilizing transposase RayT